MPLVQLCEHMADLLKELVDGESAFHIAMTEGLLPVSITCLLQSFTAVMQIKCVVKLRGIYN